LELIDENEFIAKLIVGTIILRKITDGGNFQATLFFVLFYNFIEVSGRGQFTNVNDFLEGSAKLLDKY